MKLSVATFLLAVASTANAFAPSCFTERQKLASSSTSMSSSSLNDLPSRRESLGWMLTTAGMMTSAGSVWAPSAAQAATDVEDFLKTGGVSQPMGVSGQAGKSKPEIGVVLRDGSDITRDSKSGNVGAEILLQKNDSPKEYMAALLSFTSPWSLAKGFVFDIECRDADTGDGVFVMVTPESPKDNIADIPNSFFVNQLVAPTGRFSFYGTPTDMKIKNSKMVDDPTGYRIMDVSFSTLAQSTQMEIPRKARVAATILPGSNQVVMLVASASATRWKKGSEQIIDKTIQSFRATPAPPTSLKLRAKERDPSLL